MSPLTIFIFVVTLLFGLVVSDSDPCQAYKEIDNPYRSTGYKLKPGDVAICDSNLPRGWYRFTSMVGGMMPETRPNRYHCGTVAPIWIKDKHPTVESETKTVTTCTNIRDDIECSSPETISVKKCTGSYYVYRLHYTDGCSMAYCAGNKEPCPKGLIGIVPNCTEPGVLTNFPEDLVPKPVVRYRTHLEDETFTMLCVFDFPADWKNISFAVEWIADNKLIKKETVCSKGHENQSKCQKRESHLFPNEAHAGQTLRCSIRMRYTTHPSNNFTKNWKSSDIFYAGLKVSDKHTILKACNETDVKVVFTPTVPFFNIGSEKPRFKLLRPHKGNRNDFNAVASRGDCNDYIYSQAEGSVTVTVHSVCADWNRKETEVDHVEYILEHRTVGHAFWQHKFQTTFRVSVKTTSLKECRSYLDPHVDTFDRPIGHPIYVASLDDHILYRNNQTETEIHTRHWYCTRPWHGSCTCGIAIREKDDVIVFSFCSQNILHIRLRSCCPLSSATSISQQNVNIYRVVLPSGTRLTIHRLPTYFDIYLYAPTDEYNVEGQCGNANGNPNDDHNTDIWRIKSNQNSLFDKLPSEKCRGDMGPKKWCFCNVIDSIPDVKCKNSPNDDEGYRTANKMKPLQRSLVEDSTCKTARHRRSVMIEDVIYSDEISLDNEDASFFVDDNADYNHPFATKKDRFKRSVIQQDVMSSENATKYCKQFLEQSKGSKMCNNISQSDLVSIMNACISDLKITGSLEFARGAFGVMKESCESTIFRNLSLYKNNSKGELEPPLELVKDICLNDCSNHGNCTNRTCICDKGYTSVDCSAEINAAPKLLGIYNGGLCDVRQRPCKKTDLIGRDFLNSENLTCHLQEHEVISSNWKPRQFPLEFHGKMIDIFGVRCDLPDPPTKIKEFDFEGTPASGLWISISNDGERKSQQNMRFISYDSLCMACNRTGNCSQKENTCLINGYCFNPNGWNPKDWCLLCNPGKSNNTWTRRTNNRAPSFGPEKKTKYYAILGESLHLKLKAIDPDDRPLGMRYYFINSTASKGYIMSSSGLLQWNVTSTADFTVQVADECNATDTITVTVHIVKCPCKNGGQCFPHPYHPRGSGNYSCKCPNGFNGTVCETNIDDCAAVDCGNGTCIDEVNNYTCRCNAGFVGSLCDEKVYKCTNDSCYHGVHCNESASGISCGPCPVGMSGDGKTCTAPTTTSLPTTKATTTEAPTTTSMLTTEATTTEAPTTTSLPTTKATTTGAPTTTSLPTTKATTTEAPTTTSLQTTKSTTTEEKTTTTSKATLPTTTEDKIQGHTVKAEFSLLMVWEDAYARPESEEFQFLALKLETEIFTMYNTDGNGKVKKAKVISMRKGSIVVDFELIFKEKPSDPLQLFRKNIESGSLGTFKVDPKSLRTKDETATEPTKPPKEDLTIPLIVVGVGVAILIILAVIVAMMMRQRSRSRSVKLKKDGKEKMEMTTPDSEPKLKRTVDMETGFANPVYER